MHFAQLLSCLSLNPYFTKRRHLQHKHFIAYHKRLALFDPKGRGLHYDALAVDGDRHSAEYHSRLYLNAEFLVTYRIFVYKFSHIKYVLSFILEISITQILYFVNSALDIDGRLYYNVDNKIQEKEP